MAEEETNETRGMTGNKPWTNIKQRRNAASKTPSFEPESLSRRSTESKVSLKLSQDMDIETGRAGSRQWLVEEVLRHKDAMNPALRRRKEFIERFYFGQGDEKDEESVSPPQYRLRTKKVRKVSFDLYLSSMMTLPTVDDYVWDFGALTLTDKLTLIYSKTKI